MTEKSEEPTPKTTYSLTLKDDVKVQKYHDAKSAAAAFYDVNPKKRPTMIVQTEGKEAAYVATTVERREHGKSTYSKSFPYGPEVHKDFMQAYKELEKERPPKYEKKSPAKQRQNQHEQEPLGRNY